MSSLPERRRDAPGVLLAGPARNRPTGGQRLLVVAVDETLHAQVRRDLERCGYQVSTLEPAADVTGGPESPSPRLACRSPLTRSPAAVLVFPQDVADRSGHPGGFEVDAEGLLIRPITMREAMARLDQWSHESSPAPAQAAADRPVVGKGSSRWRSAGGLQVDLDGYHIYVGSKEILLSRLETGLLFHLFQFQGRVVKRTELLAAVWGYHPDSSSRTIDAHIKRLRDKLGRAGSLIQTVRGLGYRLVDDDSSRDPRPPRNND